MRYILHNSKDNSPISTQKKASKCVQLVELILKFEYNIVLTAQNSIFFPVFRLATGKAGEENDDKLRPFTNDFALLSSNNEFN